jgi:phosphoribosylformylglycinamidine synthase
MLWEVEILPIHHEGETGRLRDEYDLINQGSGVRGQGSGSDLFAGCSRGYLLEGSLVHDQVQRLCTDLLVDPLVETGRLSGVRGQESGVRSQGSGVEGEKDVETVTVLLKPGVMDPVAQSVVDAAHDLGIPLDTVRTYRRYLLSRPLLAQADRDLLFRKVLANEAIEQVIEGPLSVEHLSVGAPYVFRLIVIPLRDQDDAGLMNISRSGQLSLSLAEMKTVQEHFRGLGRDPTDVELETLAQTWSEHCSHKTLKGRIECDGRRYDNLLKETIFAATQEVRRRLGADDWCISVFEDNAGVVKFDDRFHVCFKVETHNHPSAIEPYGGANTGLGGVIRDPLGTALGAKPICNSDVFCFAPPEIPLGPDGQPLADWLPPGVLMPRKVMQGVVAGVRDYGNRMGIPTVNGAVCFDWRYLGNPLVFCGTVGLIPVDRAHKEARPGDLIVAVGGRTGRDGIHGATFSSIELTSESEKVSGGAVQIGNAITEKKMLDVIVQARDLGLYHAITDCGAGGFSSAVGEMGEAIGAVVHLDKAPLKYEGLSYTEIWISEAQERMILAVPPANWDALHTLFAGEGVEATVIGTFEPTGRLKLFYQDQPVADLDMRFLHHGRPEVVRQATWKANAHSPLTPHQSPAAAHHLPNHNDVLLRLLASLNICSKEWIIRQYDHEVQGGSVVKPLVGIQDDGPGDAAVVMPVLGSWRGLAVGCGINPYYGDLDPYHMAALAIDEAVRNVVAVGADPTRIALLDNFCWGNTDKPEVLGALVRAAEACRDVALAYGMPFISGKDSLNNEFHAGDRHIVIPGTLLISALGIVPDVRRCVTMDLKEAGNHLILLGQTRDELGGSHYHLVTSRSGGAVPQVDVNLAPRLFHKLHQAIAAGLVRSCHDLSEGGLAIALAEMAFAGGLGAEVTELGQSGVADEIALFSESPTRFVLEVAPEKLAALEELFGNDVKRIGRTCAEARLRIGTAANWLIDAPLDRLKEAWQSPLRY